MVFLARMIGVIALYLFVPNSEADDAFMVSGGMLTVNADDIAQHGVVLRDASGESLYGIVVLSPGLQIDFAEQQPVQISSSTTSLSVFDQNDDRQLSDEDPIWNSMYLAVDYNSDGQISKGEYALIGKCGVKSINFSPTDDQVLSHHTNGTIRDVRFE